jgi:hypothetical protein
MTSKLNKQESYDEKLWEGKTYFFPLNNNPFLIWPLE